jgi:hypothetical protein
MNYTNQHWSQVTACLPEGSYKLVFEATLGELFYTAIAMDDLIIHENVPCQKPGELL